MSFKKKYDFQYFYMFHKMLFMFLYIFLNYIKQTAIILLWLKMGPLQLFFKKSDISISRKLLQLFFLVITVNDISMLSEVLLKKVHDVETTNTCRCQ